MATRVLLTIDAELTWRHHVAGRGLEESYARSIEPAGVGLSHQLKLLRRHGLKATFFVDPMPARLWGIDPVRRIVETVLGAGQEVQLHLHPNWTEARADDAGATHGPFELNDLDGAAQHALIAEACDLLVAAGAPPPVAFRAGSYAADDATLSALASLGLRYDSSHNGSQQPWPSKIGLPADAIGPVERLGVTEIPVTQIVEPGGGLRHLQLCAVSSAEMAAALDHAAAHGHPTTVIVSHSFELASRDGTRPNQIVATRFEGLCRRLAARRATQPTVHFTELPVLDLRRPAQPLPPSRTRRIGRTVEQMLSNLAHRRRA